MVDSVQALLNNITPEIYRNLQRAVELGKWPGGEVLSDEQKSLCMQAVIAYEQQHVDESERTGFIPPRKHQHCGSEKGNIADDDEQPLNFKDN